MPTVTISMTDKAYDIYRTWDKGTRSNKTSAAILQWDSLIGLKFKVIEE